MIRNAKRTDINSIAAIHLEAERAAAVGSSREEVVRETTLETKIAAWQKTMSDSSVSILVEYEVNTIRGFAAFGNFRGNHESSENIGEIHTIFVSPSFWRHGVGRVLCQAALEELRAKGHEIVRLWVYEENKAARSFYETMGFKLTNQYKDSEQGGVVSRAVLYERTY